MLSAAGGESLEFLGAYLVGRAFFGGPAAQKTFVRTFKVITIVLFLLALADSISGRWIVQDTLASIFNAVAPGALYRENMIRATATLDHPILLGAFFSLGTAIFLFSETSPLSRVFYAGLCLLGCILALSSASLLSWLMIVATYSYDRLLKDYPWRWSAMWLLIGVITFAIFLVTNAPLGWIITHLTLDPESGYFRYLIWDAALTRISQAPFVGFAFTPTGNNILEATVDCVWLAYALRFGIPMIVFLFLTNLAAIFSTGRIPKDHIADQFTEQITRAFTVVLVMFMFIGLTVHFWNYMWIYWGLCIGIRASLGGTSLDHQRRAGLVHPIFPSQVDSRHASTHRQLGSAHR